MVPFVPLEVWIRFRHHLVTNIFIYSFWAKYDFDAGEDYFNIRSNILKYKLIRQNGTICPLDGVEYDLDTIYSISI